MNRDELFELMENLIGELNEAYNNLSEYSGEILTDDELDHATSAFNCLDSARLCLEYAVEARNNEAYQQQVGETAELEEADRKANERWLEENDR